MTGHALDRAGPGRLIGRETIGRVLEALRAPGEETRIVGGAVRNALLGRAVTEIDLATSALPDDTMRRARAAGLKAIPTGFEHGTVTVVADGEPFEVTTLREDVETDGRHAIVRFGRSFRQDALRRDFTINALSVDREGRLHDHTGGLDDLAAGRVRFIGAPRGRIREDYLRILRFFRFSAEYADGPLDPDGLAACVHEREGLEFLSRERVRAEFLKVLVARRAGEVVAVLSETGMLLRLAGGVAELGRFGRAVRAELDPVARLAALLVLSPADPPRLRERLRLSNAEHEQVVTFARVLGRLKSPGVVDRAEMRRLAANFGLKPLLDTLTVVAGEPRPAVCPQGDAQLGLFRSGEETAPVFGLTGAALLRQGIPPGPEIGRRLAEAKSAWMEAGCPA